MKDETLYVLKMVWRGAPRTNDVSYGLYCLGSETGRLEESPIVTPWKDPVGLAKHVAEARMGGEPRSIRLSYKMPCELPSTCVYSTGVTDYYDMSPREVRRFRKSLALEVSRLWERLND